MKSDTQWLVDQWQRSQQRESQQPANESLAGVGAAMLERKQHAGNNGKPAAVAPAAQELTEDQSKVKTFSHPFQTAIDANIKAGMSRPDAVRTAREKDPNGWKNYVETYNRANGRSVNMPDDGELRR